MSFFPGEKLRYAETHFKFKLPWSLLYKSWPEVIIDAPFQFVPNSTPVLYIIIRDADKFPISIDSAYINLKSKENHFALKFEQLKLNASESFSFFPIELGKIKPGTYQVDAQICIRKKNKSKIIKRWNLPGLSPKPLIIKILEKDLPKAPGFVTGEMHCHTYYSADHVEYGASPVVMQNAAKAIGLDFVNFTDHAYDFAFTRDDYTKEAESPIPQFQNLKKEISSLPNKPLLLAGEEVSAGNSKKENVHLTVLAPDGYLPGLGDCGRYWLENKPTLSIEKILTMTDSPCFAAHPMQQMSALEKFVFRRGYWSSEDLHTELANSIKGIQFWNGPRDDGFEQGKSWWVSELGKGNFLLPIGGNDAHGDLNDTTSVKIPLFSLQHNRDHIFGKVRTSIFIENNALANENFELNAQKLKQAFNGENCFITNGPALWWMRNSDSIKISARSNSEMGGGFRYIRIYGRRKLLNEKIANKEELLPESLIATAESVDILINAKDFVYVRAECETADGHFAMTSAAVNKANTIA